MKKALFIGFLLSIGHFVVSQIPVQVSYSKPLAVFRFLEAISGHDVQLQEKTFDYLFASDQEEIESISQCFNSINTDYTYIWEEFPDTRKKYRSTYDLLIMALATSDQIEDLPQKLFGIIPLKDANDLFWSMKHIAPYYDRYITKTYVDRTQTHLKKYEPYIAQIQSSLQSVQAFYGTLWPENLPFLVSMYPIVGKAGFTSATPHGNTLVCNFLTDDSLDYKTRIGVMVHEAAHVFYDAQPTNLQTMVEYWFDSHPSKHASVAYKYFDEGLATAIGNGWMYESLNGQLDPKPWYNNVFIDQYGKSLLPLVKNYLTDKKQMDSLFIAQAIEIFEKQFPNSIYEYEPLLNTMTIFSNAEEKQKIHAMTKTLKSHFKISSYLFVSPIKSEETKQAIKQTKGTQLYIIDAKYRSHMNFLKTLIPDLSLNLERTRVPFKKNQYYSYIDTQNNPIIIALISGETSLEAIVKAIRKEVFINPDQVFHEVIAD